MTDQPLRVMIVEDEALLAMELQFLLEDMGHRVVGTAASLHEAIGLAERERPELALIDIYLTDGPTGVSVAKSLAETKATRVLLMSGNVNRIPPDCAGAVGYIGKPYTQSGVKSAIGYLCKGLLDPPPSSPKPTCLSLSPVYAKCWAA